MEQKRAGCFTVLVGAVLLGAVLDRCSSNPNESASVISTPAVPARTERFVTYSIGQEFSLGYWSYTVADARWLPLTPSRDALGPELQSPYRPENPDSLYLVLNVIIRNNGNSEESNRASLVSSFEVIDEVEGLEKGLLNLPGRGEPEVQMYAQSSREYPNYPTFPDLLTMLNPGMTTRGTVIFDVPQNRQYALYFEGGYKTGESAIVKLPIGRSSLNPASSAPLSDR